jgi:hypothetical protein
MAALSILVTVVSLFTFWLVVPMLVLPPLAFFLGLKSYRASKLENATPSSLSEFLSLAPMVLAVAALLFEIYAITTMYRS